MDKSSNKKSYTTFVFILTNDEFKIFFSFFYCCIILSDVRNCVSAILNSYRNFRHILLQNKEE